MKTLKILACLCIMLGFAVRTAQSQAIVINDQDRVLLTDYYSYNPEECHMVITPSGNILLTVTYQLLLTDPLVPKKGVNKIPVTGDILWEGIIWPTDETHPYILPYVYEDTEMIITSKGKAKIVYHLKPVEL